jgi:DNA-binding beta-propeller fold protein YncE
LLSLGTGAALLAACGSGAPSLPKPLVAAPEPAVSPPLQAKPAGTVIDLHAIDPEGIVDYGGTLAIAARRPDQLILINASTLTVEKRVAVNGSARHLELRGGDPVVLVPGEDTATVSSVALPSGSILSEVRVGKQPHDLATVGNTEVVADEFGMAVTAITVSTGATVTLKGPLQPGGVAASGGRVGVVDVRGRVLDVYDPSPLTLIAQVPVGAGPTHAIDLGGGVVAVADTTGGALYLVRLTGTPKVLSTVPLPGRPYGLAVDASRRVLYAATGSDNLVHAFAIGAGATSLIPGHTYPSLRQPNSLAVDPLSHRVVVVGARYDGMIQSFAP